MTVRSNCWLSPIYAHRRWTRVVSGAVDGRDNSAAPAGRNAPTEVKYEENPGPHSGAPRPPHDSSTDRVDIKEQDVVLERGAYPMFVFIFFFFFFF